MKKGWHGESKRHSLARRGIKTAQKVCVNKFVNPTLSKKAKQQLENIKDKKKKIDEYYPKTITSYQRTKLNSRWISLDESEKRIKNIKLSGVEQRQLRKELKNFKKVDYEKDLFFRGKVLEGKSKLYNNKKVRVKLSKGQLDIFGKSYTIDEVKIVK